ncbi:MAG: substrate-binding domain-containing protein, partial [Cyclobacteriaceae bacterium]|nr:substrate-binding domain-containing protein [Cyclobacteriaceae bacterium]
GSALSLASNDESHLTRIIKNNIPLVTFDRVANEVSPHQVATDDFEGSFLATKHLIDQGCTKIAHLAGDQEINIYRNRLRGYRAALEENNLGLNSEYIVSTASAVKAGQISASQLMALNNRPDAITSASDFSALGALQYCKSIGLEIPKDVAITGFANEPFTEYVDPPLTSVNQKSLEMGKMVGQVFFAQSNDDHNQMEHKKILLKPELIIRGSSMRTN